MAGRLIARLTALVLAGLIATGAAHAQETAFEEEGTSRHEGYYYPPLTGSEIYPARADTLPGSDRTRRIGFIVGVTKGQMNRAYPPRYAIYAKGAEAEKMIIVSLGQGFISNVYQARALLAQMTAVARDLPLFVENRVEDYYTFLDLLKLMGFTELTISDGATYSYRYEID